MGKERKVKNNWVGARFDDNERAELDAYVTAYESATGEELGVTTVVRRGVREFMQNHPIKVPTTTVRTQPSKPGE